MTADTRREEDQQLVRNLLNSPHLPPIPGPISPRACSAGRVSAPHLPARQMRTQIPQLHRRQALNWNQMGSWWAAAGSTTPAIAPAPGGVLHVAQRCQDRAQHRAQDCRCDCHNGCGQSEVSPTLYPYLCSMELQPALPPHALGRELPRGRKKTERCFPR